MKHRTWITEALRLHFEEHLPRVVAGRRLGVLRIPLYSITDWHRSPISDSHPFDQPGT